MKRLIYLTAFTLSLAFLSACTDSSSNDVDTGFTALDFDTSYTWDSTKEYTNLGKTGTAYTCSAADSCICIYIDKTIDGVNYTGFAVRNIVNDFNVKIYSSDGGSTYSVFLKDGSTTVSCTGQTAATIFSSGPTVANGFATATFQSTLVCGDTSYNYGGGNITAPVY
jgi:hypothetical protein